MQNFHRHPSFENIERQRGIIEKQLNWGSEVWILEI